MDSTNRDLEQPSPKYVSPGSLWHCRKTNVFDWRHPWIKESRAAISRWRGRWERFQTKLLPDLVDHTARRSPLQVACLSLTVYLHGMKFFFGRNREKDGGEDQWRNWRRLKPTSYDRSIIDDLMQEKRRMMIGKRNQKRKSVPFLVSPTFSISLCQLASCALSSSSLFSPLSSYCGQTRTAPLHMTYKRSICARLQKSTEMLTAQINTQYRVLYMI